MNCPKGQMKFVDLFMAMYILRGLIEFSNYCDKECLYCGIRHSNTNVHRFRLTEDEIIATVRMDIILV